MEARIVLPCRNLFRQNLNFGNTDVRSVGLFLLSFAFALPLFNESADAQFRGGQKRSAQNSQFRVSTENFTVVAADARLAKRVGQDAERYRKELAIQWLGHELPRWDEKCPIQVEIGMHAGGETSFAFVTDRSGRGTPTSWQMKIFGPPDRLLDAVLPHEVTHTIFATHFGRPLPRWADEGACTTVEHESEREKNHRMLLDFLSAKPSRGIPFNRMFTMRNYPHDILPLYAQGHSLAKFLIMKKGRQVFLDYVGSGMEAESGGSELQAWDQTTRRFYNYENLSDLQVAWLEWVRDGSIETPLLKQPRQTLAINDVPPVPPTPADLIQTTPSSQAAPVENRVAANTYVRSDANSDAKSWYHRQMENGERFATNRKSLDLPAKSDDARLKRNDRIEKTLWR